MYIGYAGVNQMSSWVEPPKLLAVFLYLWKMTMRQNEEKTQKGCTCTMYCYFFCHVKFLPVVVLETPSKNFLREKQTFPLFTPKHWLTINANLIQSISIFTGKYSSSYGTAIWQEIRSVVRVPRPIIGRKRRSSGKKSNQIFNQVVSPVLCAKIQL